MSSEARTVHGHDAERDAQQLLLFSAERLSGGQGAQRTAAASVCLLALRVFPVVYSIDLDGDAPARQIGRDTEKGREREKKREKNTLWSGFPQAALLSGLL